MDIMFDEVLKDCSLDIRDIKRSDPYDIADAFIDRGTGYIYIASNDVGLGPYWTCIREYGSFEAVSTINLELVGPCYEIEPQIKITF